MMYQENCESRQSLLKKISEVSFAVDDLLLYLDTHQEDEKALGLYRENEEKRKKYMAQYAASYGPLTIEDALKSESCKWQWAQQPFPWEKGV